MSRSLLLLCLFIGMAAAWNYKTGFDSHPWNQMNVWVKRSSEKSSEVLPQPPVREKAPTMSYIHKRNGASPSNDDAADLPQPIVRQNAETIPGFAWF